MQPSPQPQPVVKQKIPTALIIVIIIAAAVGIGFYIYEATRTRYAYIHIYYNGRWAGALAYGNKIVSISGYGEKEIEVWWRGLGSFYVGATIQKMDSTYYTLRVAIISEQGRVLDVAETYAPYGVVSVGWMF